MALIKESIQGLFNNYKDLAARMFIDLLDNTVPLVLDFYSIIFVVDVGKHLKKQCCVYGLFFIDKLQQILIVIS